MRHFEIAVDIDAPADRVWEIMSGIERWHEWTPSITSIKQLTQGPFAVGTRAEVRQPKLPLAVWEVTEIRPGRSFTWVNLAPGVRVVACHSVESIPAGTRARLSLDLHGLFGGLVGRLTKDITERYLAFEAAGLKARSLDPGYFHAAVSGV